MVDQQDLFLEDEHYRGGYMLKSELAALYEVSINTFKEEIREKAKTNPELFRSFGSDKKKVSPIEINSIIKYLGMWKRESQK